MKLLKSHPILSIANSFVIDSPSPSNLSYLWNYGSLLGLCLVIQIITGVTLAMHYTPHVDLAFLSVEHIMRDVNFGWLIRYLHANVASFFFFFVYLHIGKGLYYGSYKSPRTLLWTLGVIIFVVMMATAFLGNTEQPLNGNVRAYCESPLFSCVVAAQKHILSAPAQARSEPWWPDLSSSSPTPAMTQEKFYNFYKIG
jgi:hypothetical protein